MVWAGAVYAPIGIKLNSHMFSVQQQILPNSTQIGQHLGEWCPKNLFLTLGHGRLQYCALLTPDKYIISL